MSGWPSRPVVYEVDTVPWLSELRRRLGTDLTLAGLPAQIWDGLAPPGTDAVWLMGVWERSPAGLAVARRNAPLQKAFRAALPDLAPEDVAGSPYCVRRYVVDERLGGPAALVAARAQLARRGLRLILDYVPNHVAPDHPAVTAHPDWFVTETASDAAAAPESWFDAGGRVLAHGRDPYFPPWPDVVQINAFSPEVRAATAGVLGTILDQCDGVRCDMAMLLTNDVFGKTWGEHAGAAPAEEFWPAVIGQVRHRHPGAVLIAEAYWDMEWTLQQQGFDFCYDKRLYDRLVHGDASAVRMHLRAGGDFQARLIRFIENHDEPRAASSLPDGRDRAAAVVSLLLHPARMTTLVAAVADIVRCRNHSEPRTAARNASRGTRAPEAVMSLDPSTDGTNSPSSTYVDRRLVAASGLLLTGGLVVCLTGAAAGTYAVASAIRRYVADREEAPRETLRRRWGQFRSAGVAGVGAWQNFNRQTRLTSARRPAA